jgi:hypothetical protein
MTFLPPVFSQMDSSQATFKDFSNLALNSMRYSQFFIDSPLLFIPNPGGYKKERSRAAQGHLRPAHRPMAGWLFM